MNRLPVLGAAIGIGVATLVGPAAHAQMESREAIALQNQILELRHEVEMMRAQGGSRAAGPVYEAPPVAQSQPSGDLTAQLLDRVNQLEDQVRQLRGRIDEIDNARQQSEADLAKQIGDLQFKLNNGASPGAAAAAPAAAAQPMSPPSGTLGGRAAQTTPPAIPPPQHRTPEVALAAGNAALARHNYAEAEAAARDVLAAGRGPRAADAQYLLAQALAGQRNYAAAAVAYDDAYKRNPRGVRAPESLVGLANSLVVLGDKKAACQTLDKLHAEFPSPRGDLRASIAAARGRAGCR